jgi:hypothetical protein
VSITSIDLGFWSGSLSYKPSYASQPIVISIGTGPDSNGINWLWESITGWDSPDVAGAVIQRGADHGGWATGQWYAPRALTLTLRASCPNWATRDLARSILQQVIPVNDLCTLQYNEPIPKQMAVRRSGQIVETAENLQEVEFACVLIAPDPRKYSTILKTWSPSVLKQTTNLSVSFTVPPTLPNQTQVASASNYNAGNFETRPVVQITGPLHSPGVKLVNTGQSVTYSYLTLAAGEQLVLDFDARMAWHNGTYTRSDINSAWFVLQPGNNTLQLLSGNLQSTDQGLMLVQHRDAWI